MLIDSRYSEQKPNFKPFALILVTLLETEYMPHEHKSSFVYLRFVSQILTMDQVTENSMLIKWRLQSGNKLRLNSNKILPVSV